MFRLRRRLGTLQPPPGRSELTTRVSWDMSLPRTFVSFSGTDIGRYHLMTAWKAHEHIDFNFADFQLDEAINSKNPSYIQSVCRPSFYSDKRRDLRTVLIPYRGRGDEARPPFRPTITGASEGFLLL